MSTLLEKLTAPEVRPRVLSACEDLVEEEVRGKGGLGGLAIKGGLKVVKALKPGIVRELVDALLPEFAQALEPLHTESAAQAAAAGQPTAPRFSEHLCRDPQQTAEVLLSVTDARARRAANRTLKSTYERLRGVARDHVAAAVPGLARALTPFV